MNAIFLFFMLLSILFCLFKSPDLLLPAFTGGVQKSITLSVTLICVYAVWMGVFEVLKQTRLADKLAKLLHKPVELLFGKKIDCKAKDLICLNLSLNALGLSGAATPLAIEACSLLDKREDNDSLDLLFMLSATSVQILPTSVLSLLVSFNSQNAQAIILPSIICTTLSTVLGITLLKIFKRRKKA